MVSVIHPDLENAPIVSNFKSNLFKHLSVVPFPIITGFNLAPAAEIVNPVVTAPFILPLILTFALLDPFILTAFLGGFKMRVLVSS
jgi:hypothetical protein